MGQNKQFNKPMIVFENLESNIIEKAEVEFEKKLEERWNKIETTINKKVEEKLNMRLEDKEEREKRADNLIVVGLSESQEKDQSTALEEDEKKIREMLSKIVDIKEGDIQEPARLGAKRTYRPRVLRIKLKDQEMKKEILKNAYKINPKGTNVKSKVFINNDLTPAEREEDREMRKNAKEMNEKEREAKSGRVWVVRNRKIIEKPLKRMTRIKQIKIIDNQANLLAMLKLFILM